MEKRLLGVRGLEEEEVFASSNRIFGGMYPLEMDSINWSCKTSSCTAASFSSLG